VLAKKAQGICVDWVCSLIQICCSRPISKQFGGSWGEHRYGQRGYGSSRFKRLAPKQVQPLFGGKKSGRFGTSNNIISLAFIFLINRTQKFLMTYYNSCKIRFPFYILVVSYSFKKLRCFWCSRRGQLRPYFSPLKRAPMANHVAASFHLSFLHSPLQCKWMQTRRAIILVQRWVVHRGLP
jgi:hypothetical protein